MKLGVPWSVKGIRPEARETAKEAARRAGMPLADWLNTVILNSAADESIDHAEYEAGGDITAVNARLDDLTRKIDRLAQGGPIGGPIAYAPPHVRGGMPAYIPPAPQMAPVHAFSAVDRAAAEISARQRALNGEPHAPVAVAPQAAAKVTPPVAPQAAPLAVPPIVAPPVPVFAPPPAQDLSGLEEQLHRITDQIETLRRPGVEEAINALRGELAEIGHALSDAMPRQAPATIERQVQDLAQRVAEGRQAGVDGDALHGIERGLTEVRDALQGLTPAENLVGFNEAVGFLAEKIDQIVAQKDPATLQQLESAITTLRGVSAHIASNETVRQLADDVAVLAEKVEQAANSGPANEALASLEQRIAALADALAARSQNGDSVPPHLESLVSSLTSKLEQVQLSRGDNVAVSHLEDRIVQLVEKLDASDSRLGHLEAIERGLADLLLHIEDMRAQKGQGGIRGDAPTNVDALKHDLARTHDALDKVNGTLGHVVDRLAMIEQGISREPLPGPETAAPLNLPIGKIAARAVPLADFTPPAAAASPQPPAQPPRAKPAIGHDLPPGMAPDLPLEPGSGPPGRGNLAARIAASEAALGDANPPADPAPTGKSGFLRAARRAAQTAASQPAPTPHAALWSDLELPAGGGTTSLREKLTKRVKSLFVAASLIAIVIGGLQFGSNYFGLFTPASKQQSAQKDLNADAKLAREAVVERNATPAEIAAREPNREAPLPGAIPASTALGIPATIPAAPSNPNVPKTAFGSVPRLSGGPILNAPAEITGSISRQTGARAAAPHSAAVTPEAKLPIAIGGITLRTAAAAGDAKAAYEVAVRFADGRGVPVNLEEAAHWFAKAAREGIAPAQFRLGSLYEKGNGVKKDLTQARKLYAAAAAQGNAKAMHNLAVLYAEGADGKPDYTAAVQWFSKAAARGISDSQYNLGILCARGLGTEKSLTESYKWFALAADQGDLEARKKRDEISGRLDAKALAAVQHTVKAWVAEQQPEAAITVPAPEGGWDRASMSTPPANKPKRPGAFEIGKS
ncbi:MAG: hypothetical protein ACR2K5_08335 [Pseudolabrys sp.]